ncbi:unnamed protein product [Nesidiocoris tenuis]|uniref:Uncharacterized protein n=1 Tax=Nesidiocoris tenuis TaxID=355587 RepID=A0A6H5GXX9_9HEMI|nr:unnamed protein product [Nesidiocoris tenuis]
MQSRRFQFSFSKPSMECRPSSQSVGPALIYFVPSSKLSVNRPASSEEQKARVRPIAPPGKLNDRSRPVLLSRCFAYPLSRLQYRPESAIVLYLGGEIPSCPDPLALRFRDMEKLNLPNFFGTFWYETTIAKIVSYWIKLDTLFTPNVTLYYRLTLTTNSLTISAGTRVLMAPIQSENNASISKGFRPFFFDTDDIDHGNSSLQQLPFRHRIRTPQEKKGTVK